MLYNNKSLDRALQILTAFTAQQPRLTLAELSSSVKVPKATVLRLCSTLLHHEFLLFDRETKQYSLGLKLFELGNMVFASFSLRRIASPYLSALQKKLGKTVFLGILRQDELLYIDKKENPADLVRFGSEIGTRQPPCFGMLGNTLMAYLTDERIRELLKKHPLKAFTRNSLNSDKRFRKRLKSIRSQGYFVDEGEAIEGVTGVAAPVRDSSGDIVAAVGVSFLSSSEDRKAIRKIIRETQKTADLISVAIGHAA